MLIPPPAISNLAPYLHHAVRRIASLSKDFEASFVYVKGFEDYTVQVGLFPSLCYMSGITGTDITSGRSANPKGDPR
jgi:hypothetical protein